jgi:hypothetical protein
MGIGTRIAFSEATWRRRASGSTANTLGHTRRIVREIEAVARADLDYPTVEPREQRAAMVRHAALILLGAHPKPESGEDRVAHAGFGHPCSLVALMVRSLAHFTSRPTFLLEPRPWRVIVAKLIVAAGVGMLYAEGVTIGWLENDLILVTLGVLLVVAVFAVLGIGVDALSDARCRRLDRRGSRL